MKSLLLTLALFCSSDDDYKIGPWGPNVMPDQFDNGGWGDNCATFIVDPITEELWVGCELEGDNCVCNLRFGNTWYHAMKDCGGDPVVWMGPGGVYVHKKAEVVVSMMGPTELWGLMPLSSSGLGYCPLTAATRVQIPVGVPLIH